MCQIFDEAAKVLYSENRCEAIWLVIVKLDISSVTESITYRPLNLILNTLSYVSN